MSRCGFVLIDAVVDFVFVAMMYDVEQVKILLFIWDVQMSFLDFFSFLTQVPHPTFPSVLLQKKRNFYIEICEQRKNSTTWRKIMPCTLFLLFEFMIIHLKCFPLIVSICCCCDKVSQCQTRKNMHQNERKE
jgi:hypothetical protein